MAGKACFHLHVVHPKGLQGHPVGVPDRPPWCKHGPQRRPELGVYDGPLPHPTTAAEDGSQDSGNGAAEPGTGHMEAIADTACSKTVAGHEWYEAYCAVADQRGWDIALHEVRDLFKFGASRVHTSAFSVDAWFAVRGQWFAVRVAVVPCKVPLLFSKAVLARLGVCYDVASTLAVCTVAASFLPVAGGAVEPRSGHSASRCQWPLLLQALQKLRALAA